MNSDRRNIIDQIDALIDDQLAAGEPRTGYDYGDPTYHLAGLEAGVGNSRVTVEDLGNSELGKSWAKNEGLLDD